MLNGIKHKDGAVTFFGKKVSKYAEEHNAVDYATLFSAFDAVLANNIMQSGYPEDWQLVSGSDYDDETDGYMDIFQYYIVSEYGAEILQDAGEIVYYNDRLDIFVCGITHYGTSWDYVLTDIQVISDADFYNAITE